MHLRKMSRTNREVSIDEPLNVDYDGNELLLVILSVVKIQTLLLILKKMKKAKNDESNM